MKIELTSEEWKAIMAPGAAMTEEVIRLNAERVRLEKQVDSLGRDCASRANDPRIYTKDQLTNALSVVCAYLSAGSKISAIKHVREITHLGLKEAKDLVEGNYMPTPPRY
jgi:ribosomal protein L7/L12